MKFVKCFCRGFILGWGVPFPTVERYDTLNTYDITAAKALRGGGASYLPALRQSKVIFKYGDKLNLAEGININQDNNTGTIIGSFKFNTRLQFAGKLEYKTTYLSPESVDKIHKVRFGMVLKLERFN